MSYEVSYEVLAVRYATREARASEMYALHPMYGEPDRGVRMDYYFWLVRGGGRTIMVDTGFAPEVGDRRGRVTLCALPDALARLGVAAEDVDTVVVTHAHYDHAGQVGLLPRAEIVISDRELTFWTGRYGRRPQFAHATEPADIDALRRLDAEGRVTRIRDRHPVAPGVELAEVGGHTPGQLVVLVDGEDGPVLLASDAVHYYEELDLDRPFAVFADLTGMYRGFDTVRELAAGSGGAVVAGHDPAVLTRFTSWDAGDPGFAVRVG
ncbi:MBL fold metallo-hydrolase [Acrocarpospora phusangensis]|uniref:MBL fold metallo-hydrolase n=1 Tax=Acrocarpospora phusangensis TaxID=1070424 RepID=A0A919Q8U5_9ACTN|nr:N-acyl homoserine lactonase family protein [Acrocarpospora phusangensis]GIH24143.1 MBL fold metallo-hydrolase [Acrocarpospora phusangensis]